MKNAELLLSSLLKNSHPENEQALLLADGKKYIETLYRRGLDDACVAAQLAFDSLQNGKTPKKLPAELYDKVNYLCRCYMDRIARFMLCYDFVPDVKALQTAILCLFEKAPVFHSVFTDNHIRPYWKVADYTLKDVFFVQTAEDLQTAAIDFLEQGVAIDDPSQMKIALIHNEKQSILALRWNHMIMDGGGFKQFMTDLCSAYDYYRQTGETPLDFRTGTRKYTAVYDDLPEQFKKKAKLQFANASRREKRTLPFTKKNGEEKNRIVSHSVDADVFAAACTVAKQNGATVNDCLAAAYISAVYETIGGREKPLSLSCAVDLRRYMKQPKHIGYTNHTTFMYCTVAQMETEPLALLRSVADSTKKNKQDPYLGLHGIPLLNFGYTAMIQLQAETVVKLFYNNANLALSNVGPVDVQGYSLDGHAVTDALVAGGAKFKPCAAATALTVNGKLTISVCTKGNEQDKEMLQAFFCRIEQYFRALAEK